MNELIKVENLNFSAQTIQLLMPYLTVCIGGMIALLAGVLKFSKNPIENRKKQNISAFGVSVITSIFAIYYVLRLWGETQSTLFNGMMAADYYSNLFNLILLIATSLVLLSSWSYLEKEEINYAEYYSLVLFACLGMMFLASALDLVVLFVALEIMSIAVYVLVGFRRTDIRSNEAAIKYFILGGGISAVLLYGVALTYGATGTMNLKVLAQNLSNYDFSNPILILGLALLVVGFLFKVATVPFHVWMPDVYEGAPMSITNLMTTGLKAAAFGAFLRVFSSVGSSLENLNQFQNTIHDALWVIAVATMFIGNAVALTQKNIKRMLAFSSIAHTGYMLVGFIAGMKLPQNYSSVVMYVVAYVIMNLGTFAILSMLSEKGDEHVSLDDLAGFGFKHPVFGLMISVFMFSMAGVPPTAGFAGKYLIFSSAVEACEIWLAVLGVLCSVIGAYYYLRVIVYMYMKEPVLQKNYKFSLTTTLVVILSTLGTIQFGVFPKVLIEAAKKAALSM